MNGRVLLRLHITCLYTQFYQMINITKTITYNFIWQLDSAENYKFTKCKKLFNTKTMREIKKTVNGYSVGFWISKKFYTLENLRKRLIKIEKQY